MHKINFSMRVGDARSYNDNSVHITPQGFHKVQRFLNQSENFQVKKAAVSKSEAC